MDGEPFQPRRWRPFVVAHALVQGDDAEPGGQAQGQPVPLQHHLPLVEDRRDAAGRGRRQPLGHGEQDHAAVGFDQNPPLGHPPAAAQRGGEVEPSQQPPVGDLGRHPAHGRVGRQQRPQQRQPAVAPGARPGTQRDAAQPHGVDG